MKNQKNVCKMIFPLVFLIIFILPLFTFASDHEGKNPPSPKTTIVIVNPFKQDTIKGFIETIVNDILIPIGAVVAVIMIMYAGFKYVTARGEPAEIAKAHKALLWGVIGAAILLGAWVISQAIGETINQLKK